MRTRRFRKPIVVQPGRIDRDRVVLSVSDAAEVLLKDWPTPASKTRLAAIAACLAVPLPGAEVELVRQSLDPNRHSAGHCACRAAG
ncbi:MAG: DUF982 domain-containing protein [Mesorhizobium sp.]|nr:MAG: DUF982 domain-containing protein [Mesorhizobium sp.]